MHPMFVELFIETDADDLLASEEARRRQGGAPHAGPGAIDRLWPSRRSRAIGVAGHSGDG